MDLLEGILTRRSVRKFTDEPVGREAVMRIIEAGRWAPSGLNNQPWRFVVVMGQEMRQRLSAFTKYGKIIEHAPASIALFIDKQSMYNETKDHQSMGACAENMLLAAHALGLGAVWLGEILNRADEVRLLFGLPERYALMAVIALGHPASRKHTSERMGAEDVMLGEF